MSFLSLILILLIVVMIVLVLVGLSSKKDIIPPVSDQGIPPLEKKYLNKENKECTFRGISTKDGCKCYAGFSGKNCEKITCANSDSYFTMAKKEILKVWDRRVKGYITKKASRMDYLYLRDKLYVFGFAFGNYDYAINYRKYNLNLEKGKITYRDIKTYDLIEVLLYYTSTIYHVWGDSGDMASTNPNKERWSSVYKSMIRDFAKLLDGNQSKFRLFLGNPSDRIHENKNRETSGQFWGTHVPLKRLNGYENISLLVMYQCENLLKKYKKFNDTIKWDFFSNNMNVVESHRRFDEYHKIRKLIRSLSRTIVDFSFVFPALGIKVPKGVLDLFGIDKTKDITYGQVLTARTDSKSPVDEMKGQYICSAIYAANKEYPVNEFWGLTQTDFNFLRGLLLMQYEAELGYKTFKYDNILTKDTACPSKFDDFVKRNKYIPTASPLYNWKEPVFKGRICNLVTYMGDVHDKMVEYVKNQNDDLKDLIIKTTRDIELLFNDNNFEEVVKSVSRSTCGYSKAINQN